MSSEVPRFVAVQRPSPGSGGFVNLVFEVELELLRVEQQCYILRKIRPVEIPYKRGMPFMHKGYFDSHLHVSGLGWAEEAISLQRCANPFELVQKLLPATPNSRGFVEGFGWSESSWNLGHHDLEKVFQTRLPEHAPVYAKRICGHSALVNEAFKKWIGMPGLTTFVTDKDLAIIDAKLEAPSTELVKKWILRGQELLLDQGITAVGDMSLSQNHVDAFAQIAADGLLKIDFQGIMDAGRAPGAEAIGPQCFRNANDWGPLGRAAEVQLRHWKKYLDGSFGSHTAWLSQMYADQDSFGEQLETFEKLYSQSQAALNKGFYLSFHTIGDASFEMALKLGEKLKRELTEHRQLNRDLEMTASTHRLEHSQLIRSDQLERLKQQDFWTLCLQPHHRVADAAFIKNRLGSKRYNDQAYRLASLREQKISFALGSDAPIDDMAPLAVLRSCMNDERSVENLTFEEALWNYTTGARLRLGLKPGLLNDDATVFLTPSL